MLTSEVKLLNENQETTFKNLKRGEGIVGTDGTRIKVDINYYLHFQSNGEVFLVGKASWPLRANGKEQRFRLIAEEI